MGRNEIILIWGLSFPFGLNSLWHLIKMIKRKEKRNYLFMFMCSTELVCAVIPLLSNRLIGLTCLSTGLYFFYKERFIEDYASLYYEFYAKIRFYGIVFNLIFMGIMFLLVEFEEEERPLWNNCNYTEVDREQYNTDVNVFVNQYLDNINKQEWLKEDYPDAPINDRFFVDVDTILYNRDGGFLFVFYGRGDRCAIADTCHLFERPAHYHCESAIGYRDTIQNSIVFYMNDWTVNLDDYRDGMDKVECYYLNNYKNEGVIPSRIEYGDIGYNVNDPLFFDNSLLFKKYNDTLYFFQIDHFKTIVYRPDSIIIKKHF